MICDREKCTGCGACDNVCPKNAIDMQQDEYGFKVPVIDKGKCIGCGMCARTCPANSGTGPGMNDFYRSYAMYNEDDSIARQSSSGGIFYSISRYVIEGLQGIVFGAVMDNHMQVRIVSAEHMDEVGEMMGSKYVYSSTGHTFREARECLESGRHVLYSGLPCQISGLLSYLGKDYDRLATLEVLCHGAPSQGLFDRYIKEVGKKYGAAVRRVVHRDGDMDWNPLIQKRIAVELADGGTVRMREDDDIYMSLFIRELSYNTTCYSCPYANPNRKADITLGDYGGLGVYKEFQHKNRNGVSFVRINSQKAYSILQKLDGIYMEQRPDEEIGLMNSAIVNPVAMPEEREQFMEDYRCMEGDSLFQKYFYKDYRYKLRKNMKSIAINLLGPETVARIICHRKLAGRCP